MTVAPTIYFLLLFVDLSVYFVCGSPSLLRLENPVGLFRGIKIEIEIEYRNSSIETRVSKLEYRNVEYRNSSIKKSSIKKSSIKTRLSKCRVSKLEYRNVEYQNSSIKKSSIKKSSIETRVSKCRVLKLEYRNCLLYTSPSPRDATLSRMPSSA